jgi:hypothetical protein
MPVSKAVDIIMKAVYLGREEIVVGKFFYWIIPKLCFLSDTFNNIAGNVKYKS